MPQSVPTNSCKFGLITPARLRKVVHTIHSVASVNQCSFVAVNKCRVFPFTHLSTAPPILKEVKASLFTEVTLQCSVDWMHESPYAVVQWFKNGQPVLRNEEEGKHTEVISVFVGLILCLFCLRISSISLQSVFEY